MNSNQNLHPDIKSAPFSQGGDDRLLSWESWAVHPSTPDVLQLLKIWTPQRNLLRTAHMCQWTIWRKIVWSKFEVQTASKITWLVQYLAMFTRKKRKYLRWNMRNMSFQEARKIKGTYMGENSYASFEWRADTTNEDNNSHGKIDPVRCKWLAKVSGAPKKKYTQLNFTKHQLSNGLGMGRDSMW